jgi:hypothetical protein
MCRKKGFELLRHQPDDLLHVKVLVLTIFGIEFSCRASVNC